MLVSHKLPLAFDAELLKADLGRLTADDWVAHFNKGYYKGEWKGLALVSTTGNSNQLFHHPNDTGLGAQTAILDRCPYFREVLETFQTGIIAARLLGLSPGSKILEHVDFFLGLEDGVLRVHVPIQTDPRVDFFVNNERLVLLEGEVWYIDFTLPHHVTNHSDKDRVHLILDCVANDWLLSMIPFGDEALKQLPVA